MKRYSVTRFSVSIIVNYHKTGSCEHNTIPGSTNVHSLHNIDVNLNINLYPPINLRETKPNIAKFSTDTDCPFGIFKLFLSNC